MIEPLRENPGGYLRIVRFKRSKTLKPSRLGLVYHPQRSDATAFASGRLFGGEQHGHINAASTSCIPPSYISGENQRLGAYKRIGQAPMSRHGRRWSAAEKTGIEAIDRRHTVLNVKFHDQTRVDAVNLMALVSGTRCAQFTPAGVLRLPVDGEDTPAAILDYLESGLISQLV
jgi:hypothetical protein